MWLRICRECGYKTKDVKPVEVTHEYKNRRCRNCKAEALDYGREVVSKAILVSEE